ncbi:glycoside hydrolase family 78 protein [bacterium]|nr:glycoside hydrolase family 78 protein [bacterium]
MLKKTNLVPKTVKLKASWIWGMNKSPNTCLYFRKIFRYPDPASQRPYRLYVGADSKYSLWINGHFLGRGPVPGTSTWKILDSYNVDNFLQEGENVICVLVHYIGEDIASYRKGAPGLIIEAHDRQKNIFLSTNEAWKIYPENPWGKNVQFHWGLGYSEFFDSAKAPHDWLENKEDDSSWQSAVIQSNVTPKLYCRIIAPISEKRISPKRIVFAGYSIEDSGPESQTSRGSLSKFLNEEKLIPDKKVKFQFQKLLKGEVADFAQIHKGRNGVFATLDFGKEVVGYPDLDFESSSGMIVDMAWAEILKPTEKDCDYERKFFQANKYISVEGRNYWQCINYRGFRYLHLVFRRISPYTRIRKISCNFRSLPAPQKGFFECSDPILNKIWNMAQYTVQLCRQETFIDCPHREQTQATGDSRLVAQFAYLLFGDDSLWRQFLWQIGCSQDNEGLIETYYPGYHPTKLLDFCLQWIGTLWEHYQITGIDTLLRKYYLKICRTMKWFEKRLGSSGTLEKIESGDFPPKRSPKHQMFIDHPGISWFSFPHHGIARYGNLACMDMFFLEAVEAMILISRLLRRKKEEKHFLSLSMTLRKGIYKRYWVDKKAVFCDGFYNGKQVKNISQQTNALALYLGLVRKDKIKNVIDTILNEKDPTLCRCTPYFWYFLFRGLSRNGCYESGFPFIKRLWEPMLRNSSSGTCWEIFSEDYSLCHAWSATPVFELMTEILGVKPAAPGFKFVKINPKPCGLKWARGIVPTPKGPIRISWENKNQKLNISYELPKGIKVYRGKQFK